MRRRGRANSTTRSYGAGSGPHLATELFAALTGVRMQHVPYGGGGPAALGAMTNQVQALFSSVLPVLGMVRGEKLRALAIAADKRSELLPDVPTFAEQGIDYRTGTWFGLLAPARTPLDIVIALNRATVATLEEPGVRAKIVEQGAEVIASSPAQFRAFLKEETDRLSAVIRNAGSCSTEHGALRDVSAHPSVVDMAMAARKVGLAKAQSAHTVAIRSCEDHG